MKKCKWKMPYFSPDFKRKTIGLMSVILVISAIIFLFYKKTEKIDLVKSDSQYYEWVKDYMQLEYIEAYADYFEVMYIEELDGYEEKISEDGKRLEASFLMKAYYRYPYRDPDTVQKVIEAREKGDMAEYKRLYDGYNQMHNADYSLKIEAEIEESRLKDVKIYVGTDNGNCVLLENGLKDYIIEE